MTYTVDNLLEKLALVGNNKIWKEITETVTVKGVVSSLKLYDKTAYFDLEGSGKKIKAICDKSDAPCVGEAIEFNGLIMLKTNTFGTALQIQIKGSPVGTWERHKPGPVLTKHDLVKYNNQPIESFMSELQHGHLFVLIGSDTAINDIVGTVAKEHNIHFDKRIVSVSKKQEILKALKRFNQQIEPVAVFAVVRGGDDESITVWDDSEVVKALLDVKLPFYTALGHAHRLTLADSYAAKSFPTPSNLATDINHAAEAYAYQHSQTARINQLTSSLQQTEKTITQLKQELQTPKDSIWKSIAIGLFIILIIAVLILKK